jgi:hypothetical protein
MVQLAAWQQSLFDAARLQQQTEKFSALKEQTK